MDNPWTDGGPNVDNSRPDACDLEKRTEWAFSTGNAILPDQVAASPAAGSEVVSVMEDRALVKSGAAQPPSRP